MDHYSVLGVSPDASKQEIKAAFRKKALDCHPDRHACSPKHVQENAERTFKVIKEAYDTLSDDRRRMSYSSTASSASSGFSNAEYEAYMRSASRHRSRAYAAPGLSDWLRMFTRNMTRGDALMHAMMGGALFGGLLVFGAVGETMWSSYNEGKSFDAMQGKIAQWKQQAYQIKSTMPPSPGPHVQMTTDAPHSPTTPFIPQAPLVPLPRPLLHPPTHPSSHTGAADSTTRSTLEAHSIASSTSGGNSTATSTVGANSAASLATGATSAARSITGATSPGPIAPPTSDLPTDRSNGTCAAGVHSPSTENAGAYGSTTSDARHAAATTGSRQGTAEPPGPTQVADAVASPSFQQTVPLVPSASSRQYGVGLAWTAGDARHVRSPAGPSNVPQDAYAIAKHAPHSSRPSCAGLLSRPVVGSRQGAPAQDVPTIGKEL